MPEERAALLKIDMTGWEYGIAMGAQTVYTKGHRRRIVDFDTGKVVLEYDCRGEKFDKTLGDVLIETAKAVKD